MNALRTLSVALLVVAAAVGTLSDRPVRRPPISIAGYRVLAADFHTHSSMWSDGALTPWGLVLEAERQGLDAIAITGHDATLDGKIGRWFSRLIGGPIVIAGEEILGDPYHYHLVALGIGDVISFDQRAADAIDAVHRQGGVAIAAHPIPQSWPAYDADAMQRLDAAEICHPLVYTLERGQTNLEQFAARGSVAAIGSSDFHGTGRLGMCRTLVFVREVSEAGILDAIRARRTVVFGRNGRAYGNPDLIRAAANDRELTDSALTERVSALDWISRVASVFGLAGVAVLMVRARG